MSFRAALIGGLVVAMGVGPGAAAQIESDSMGDLSAWGQRYLSTDEPEFPTSLWQHSSPETLLALMHSIRTADLNPAERRLLRRVVLSPAARPSGEAAEDLARARARLLLDLGEAHAAAALAPQLNPTMSGLDPESLVIDLDLASGREASACGTLNGPVNQDPYRLKLRAVCAVLQENYSGAQLAIEVAAAQGVEDAWLVEAIFAAAGDAPNPPGARFDSGLNIALSIKAGLETTETELVVDRPDLAAAAVLRPDMPLNWRVKLAELANARDLIPVDQYRALLQSQVGEETYAPASRLGQALIALGDPLVADGPRAKLLAIALTPEAADTLSDRRSKAQLLLPDLQTLPQTPETALYAIDFARASLLAGDHASALVWLNGLDFEGLEAPDPFDSAVLEAAIVMAGGEASRASLEAIEARMIVAAISGPRENQIARVLTLWTGLGLPLSPTGRDFVGQVSDRGDRIAQGQLTSLKAARLSNAIGEAALIVLATTNGETDRLATSDVVALIETLIAMDAADLARDLALEASGYWQEYEE